MESVGRLESVERPTDRMLLLIYDRINKNRNMIIIINGATGSGKTFAVIYQALKVSQQFGTHFTLKDNMDFSFPKLLEKMQLPVNDKPGTPFIFEEVGAFGGGASSSEWQSKANKYFSAFMQTSRHRNQVLFMTCPVLNFLDKKARDIVHMQQVMCGIDYTNHRSFLRPYIVQPNYKTGKVYVKYARYILNGVRYKFNQYACSLPPPEILDEYEIFKREYTDCLNSKIINANI